VTRPEDFRCPNDSCSLKNLQTGIFSHDKIFIMAAPPTLILQKTLTGILQNKTPANPIRIGIAGGSGSGKTTIARRIEAGLGGRSVVLLGLDRFFKPETELPKYWSNYHQGERPNFNHPDSLKVDEMLAYCSALSGFDVIIFDGHFALYYPQMRAMMDIKCFVDIDLDEMLERRTRRNLDANYGGSAENIWHYNRECVAPSYCHYLLPTVAYADVIIPNNVTSAVEQDQIITAICQAVHTYTCNSPA
jgi:uridine kinase